MNLTTLKISGADAVRLLKEHRSRYAASWFVRRQAVCETHGSFTGHKRATLDDSPVGSRRLRLLSLPSRLIELPRERLSQFQGFQLLPICVELDLAGDAFQFAQARQPQKLSCRFAHRFGIVLQLRHLPKRGNLFDREVNVYAQRQRTSVQPLFCRLNAIDKSSLKQGINWQSAAIRFAAHPNRLRHEWVADSLHFACEW